MLGCPGFLPVAAKVHGTAMTAATAASILMETMVGGCCVAELYFPYANACVPHRLRVLAM